MPPVMGAAFIMAETINVPYVEIAKVAAILMILYFFTVFWMSSPRGRSCRTAGPAQGGAP